MDLDYPLDFWWLERLENFDEFIPISLGFFDTRKKEICNNSLPECQIDSPSSVPGSVDSEEIDVFREGDWEKAVQDKSENAVQNKSENVVLNIIEISIHNDSDTPGEDKLEKEIESEMETESKVDKNNTENEFDPDAVLKSLFQDRHSNEETHFLNPLFQPFKQKLSACYSQSSDVNSIQIQQQNLKNPQAARKTVPQSRNKQESLPQPQCPGITPSLPLQGEKQFSPDDFLNFLESESATQPKNQSSCSPNISAQSPTDFKQTDFMLKPFGIQFLGLQNHQFTQTKYGLKLKLRIPQLKWKIKLLSETQEQRYARLRQQKIRSIQKYLQETPELKEERLKKQRMWWRQKYLDETPEQKKKRLGRMRVLSRKYLVEETPEQRTVRLEKLKMLQKRKIRSETEEERLFRLKKMNEATQKCRSQETPEQREVRLEKMRMRRKQYLTSETPEQKALRLQKMRVRQKQCSEPKGSKVVGKGRRKNKSKINQQWDGVLGDKLEENVVNEKLVGVNDPHLGVNLLKSMNFVVNDRHGGGNLGNDSLLGGNEELLEGNLMNNELLGVSLTNDELLGVSLMNDELLGVNLMNNELINSER